MADAPDPITSPPTMVPGGYDATSDADVGGWSKMSANLPGGSEDQWSTDFPRLAALAAGLSPQAALSADLYRAIVDAYYAMPAWQRSAPGTHWVMNAEWWDECRRMTGSDGRLLWEPGATLLLGKPVEVRKDGGVPHLEA